MSETGKTAAKPKANAKKAAAKTTRGLGRGLSSLLGDSAVAATLGDQSVPGAVPVSAATTVPTSVQAVVQVAGDVSTTGQSGSMTGIAVRNLPVEWINPGPWQPRRIFDQDALQELAASMRQQGVVQPILVRENPEKAGRYQIIAGERRWRAAQIAQLHEIPALIREMNDKDASEISLIENIQRRDLNVIEEALAYKSLIDIHDYKQVELSEIIGKSRSHIANLMRLLSLPSPVQTMVSDGTLTMGQVRPLVGHSDAERLALYIAEKSLSARDAETLAKHGIPQANSASEGLQKTADIRDLEDRAKRELGLAVSLDWKDQKERGSIKISVQSLDSFEDILRKIGLNL